MLSSFCNYSQDTLYSFFSAGHIYGSPGNPSNGIYDKFTDLYSYLKSKDSLKFGVLTGDIVKNPSDEAWDYVDEDILELGLPVFYAVGNHDMRDRELFEQRYGETYQYFVFNNDLFIILDPNIENWNISQSQLDMINTALDNHQQSVDNIFVFFHQILWIEKGNIYSSVKPNSYEGKADTINFWSDVEPLFYKLPNDVVMYSGDLGGGSWASNFMFDQYENITLIASGMGNNIDDNFVITNVLKNKQVDFDLISLGTDNLFALGDIYSYDIFPDSPHEEVPEFLLYPNPITSDKIIVQDVNGSFLEFFNILGVRVLSKQITSNYFEVDVSDLSPDIYIVKVSLLDKYRIQKVIKN